MGYNRLDNNTERVNHEIKININKEEGILTIEDTGIGMNREDVLNNIGTIASSGTKRFMNELKDKNDLSLIGQFGVGFYSAFLVADKVKVLTKKNDDSIYEWESNGGSNYYLKEDNSLSLDRGTRIELYLREDCKNYLDQNIIKDIVQQHSQYISYPIKLLVTKTRQVEVGEEETENNEKVAEDNQEVKVEDVTDDNEEN